jgi:choline dehydrogenase-like flavoprotein
MTVIESILESYTRYVRRGGTVVLACGALETPKLLMLSGVGPATELRRHGIPLVADAPHVGDGLIERKVNKGALPTHSRPTPISPHTPGTYNTGTAAT